MPWSIHSDQCDESKHLHKHLQKLEDRPTMWRIRIDNTILKENLPASYIFWSIYTCGQLCQESRNAPWIKTNLKIADYMDKNERSRKNLREAALQKIYAGFQGQVIDLKTIFGRSASKSNTNILEMFKSKLLKNPAGCLMEWTKARHHRGPRNHLCDGIRPPTHKTVGKTPLKLPEPISLVKRE